jgi:hypothetical protein
MKHEARERDLVVVKLRRSECGFEELELRRAS